MLMTPGTPPGRVKIFREAYAKALKDPELLLETGKGRDGCRADARRRVRRADQESDGPAQGSRRSSQEDARQLTCAR
jgi:hypothetical protein